MKPLPKPATDRHIKIYDEDWEFIATNFGIPGGLVPKGTANVVRELIHSGVKQLRRKMELKQDD